MPKKLYTLEPPVIYDELLRELREKAATAELEEDRQFLLTTPDPMPESFASTLINQHYPSQSELPLT